VYCEKSSDKGRGSDGQEPAVHNPSNARNRVHESIFKYELLFQNDGFVVVQGGGKETVQEGRSAS